MRPDDTRLFAYGTLMLPPVLRAVSGLDRVPRPATLAGYACFRLKDHVFPGIAPWPGAITEGMVVDAIDPASWQRLDQFESGFYVRAQVQVATRGGARLTAQAYVVRPDYRWLMTDEAWDPAAFECDHLATYLHRCA